MHLTGSIESSQSELNFHVDKITVLSLILSDLISYFYCNLIQDVCKMIVIKNIIMLIRFFGQGNLAKNVVNDLLISVKIFK